MNNMTLASKLIKPSISTIIKVEDALIQIFKYVNYVG